MLNVKETDLRPPVLTLYEHQAPDHNVYYAKATGQELLRKYGDPKICTPILGTGARRDTAGNIWWIQYRNLAWDRSELTRRDYVQISHPDPRARLLSPYTVFQNSIGLEVHRSLTVEDAIRAVRDHILPAEKDKELFQARVAESWGRILIKFYCSGDFADIKPEEMQYMDELTKAVFQEIGVEDPQQLVNELKRRAFTLLMTAGGGKDSTGRENYLTTRQALEAAKKRILKREKIIKGVISNKYERIHAALEATRAIDREILKVVVGELRTMSGIVVFKRPEKVYRASTVDPTVAKLEDLISRLALPNLNPYRKRGKYATEELHAISEKLQRDGKVSTTDVNNLVQVRKHIQNDLDEGARDYASSTSRGR